MLPKIAISFLNVKVSYKYSLKLKDKKKGMKRITSGDGETKTEGQGVRQSHTEKEFSTKAPPQKRILQPQGTILSRYTQRTGGIKKLYRYMLGPNTVA